MVLQFIQIRTGFSAAYEVTDGSSRLYHAEIPLGLSPLKLELYKKDQLFCYMDHGHVNSVSWMKTKILSTRNIFGPDNQPAGAIYLKRNKRFGGYEYYEMEFNRQTYLIYTVACGKEGIKIPIYLGTEQIALIEKDPTVYDNKDTYMITSAGETAADIACIFNLFYDFTNYGHRGEFVSNTKKVYYEYTYNKELKSKYDPKFKEMIR